jgi:aspartate/methionine/tyrosine aminotransferase
MVIRLKLANRMSLIKPSGTISMSEKARSMKKKGKEIYSLAIGEPNFDTPEHIKKAAIEAINDGFTHYTSSQGIIELRKAISEDLRKRMVDAEPEEELIVTPGSKHAIFCACLATLNSQDEVLVLTPAWPTHFTCVEASEARVVEVPCGETYDLDEEVLKNKITKKSKMIITNSPNNPTGGVLKLKSLKVIADLAADYNLLILSDEIYDKIVYSDSNVRSFASIENVRNKVIMVNGFSKTYAMTGWRLGYAFAKKKIIKAMEILQQTTTTCPPSFVQKAGIVALTRSDVFLKKMIKEYDLRRRFIVKKLNEIPGISCTIPKGAFYAFPNFSNLKMSSFEISNRLLEEEGVCSTPGRVFGECGEGHIRCSYATDLETISKALFKIESFVKRYL